MECCAASPAIGRYLPRVGVKLVLADAEPPRPEQVTSIGTA